MSEGVETPYDGEGPAGLAYTREDMARAWREGQAAGLLNTAEGWREYRAGLADMLDSYAAELATLGWTSAPYDLAAAACELREPK